VLVLDTNALFSILSNPNQFGRKTQKLLARSSEIYFSPVSVFEIAIKEMLGKIRLRYPLGSLLGQHDMGSLPLRVEDALETYYLPSLVKHDPFDRLILATAKARGAKLITSDREMLNLGFEWILDSSQ
jgi:PIN domain nuclease of toxin-antitoxin system